MAEMVKDGTTRRFGEMTVAVGRSLDGVPSSVLEHLKLCMLDTLGCGLFGSTLPWSRIVARIAALERGANDESRSVILWGHPQVASLAPTGAALTNGAAVHAFELDDLHPASVLHPGSVALSAALAMANSKKDGCDGRTLIAAVLAGYEIGARVGMVAGTPHLARGWHPTGTHGTFAASAAAGSVLKLDVELMSHALAIGGSQSAGLLATQRGAMAKRLHAGRAAESGVLATLLANAGFTGAEDLLEAEYGGYYATFSGPPESKPCLALPGKPDSYETIRVGFKPYSCGGSNHTAVEAIQGLMNEEELEARDVREVLVECTTATFLHGGWPYQPGGVTAAQMNLGYCLAVTLLEGETFVEQFREELLNDTRVIELAARVRVRVDPELDERGVLYRHSVRLTVGTYSGRILYASRDTALGSSSRPLTRDHVLVKYRRLAGYALTTDSVSALEELILNLERCEDIEQLSLLLAPDGLPG